MLRIELVPDLSHCIETVAKREHREALEKLLGAEEETKELQERLEVLRIFLETMDFNVDFPYQTEDIGRFLW